MKKIAISIIIPIYNAEKYLVECLDSVVNQTFKNIEIICVNDGSTDKSSEIIKDYARRDGRIKIITQKNAGLSTSRNNGMEIATGEYIMFVDSDDWLSLDAAEKAFNEIDSKGTDFSFFASCSVDSVTGLGSEYMRDHLLLKGFREELDGQIFTPLDTIKQTFYLPVTAWSKIYRSSFLEQINARFPDGLLYEDGPFFYYIYKFAQKVSFTKEVLYYYRVNNQGSITKNISKNFQDYFTVVDMIEEITSTYSFIDEIKDNMFKFKIIKWVAIFEKLPLYHKIRLYNIFSQKFLNLNLSYDGQLKIKKESSAYYSKFDFIRNTTVFDWLREYFKKNISSFSLKDIKSKSKEIKIRPLDFLLKEKKAEWISLYPEESQGVQIDVLNLKPISKYLKRFVYNPCGVLKISDAIINLQGEKEGDDIGFVLTKGGEIIYDLSWYGRPLEYGDDCSNSIQSIVKKINMKMKKIKPKKIKGKCLFLKSNWSNSNFGHFVLDSLFRVITLTKCNISLDTFDYIVLDGKNFKHYKDLINIFGVDESKIIELKEPTCFETIYYPSLYGGKRVYREGLNEFFKYKTGKIYEELTEFVYIERDSIRDVENKKELYQLLSKYNFKILKYDDENFLETIAKSKIIIAPHGPDLTYLIFANRECKVIELMPDHHQYPYYFSLSKSLGIDYSTIICESVNTEARTEFFVKNDDNFFVDIEFLQQQIKKNIPASIN